MQTFTILYITEEPEALQQWFSNVFFFLDKKQYHAIEEKAYLLFPAIWFSDALA